MIVGVADRRHRDQSCTDAGEQDVGAIGVDAQAEFAAEATQPLHRGL